MNDLESFTWDGRQIRTVQMEDDEQYVVDLGPDGFGADVDVVGDIAIVVLASGDQYELSLPDDDAQAFIRNGVLTITKELEA